MEKIVLQSQKQLVFDGICLDIKYKDLITELKKNGIDSLEKIRQTALSSYVQESLNNHKDFLRDLQICIADTSDKITYKHEWDDAIGKTISIENFHPEDPVLRFSEENSIKSLYDLLLFQSKSHNSIPEKANSFISAICKMPVSVFTISSKTVNILKKNGIWTVENLLVTGLGFLSHLPGMTSQELNSIQADLIRLPEIVNFYKQITTITTFSADSSDEQDLTEGVENTKSVDGNEEDGAFTKNNASDENTESNTFYESEQKLENFITKQAFRDYLELKGYKKEERASYCACVAHIENKYAAKLFEIEITICRENIKAIKYAMSVLPWADKKIKDAFNQFEQFVNSLTTKQTEPIYPIITQNNNIALAYAESLDHFLFNNYTKNRGKVTATTVTEIQKAWASAQTQKFIIQSPSENPLTFSRIAQSFRDAAFIGDIEISDDEYNVLIYYFRHLFEAEKNRSGYKMKQDPFFAIILVQIGMKYYNQNFWPDVSRELDKPLDGNKQRTLRQNFISVLENYGKIHLENDDFMNIMMHGFVSDYYAPDFFSMLYRYYRIDLHRNLENNTADTLDRMLMRIGENKNTQFVVQTKYAVKNNPKRSAEIINNLLYLLDLGFHDNEFRDPTTRLHRLLNQWMNSDEAFRTALQREERTRTVYVKRFSKPYLYYNYSKETISLVIPPQMVDDEGQETLRWFISTNHEKFELPVDILEEGITGAKTDQLKFELPFTQWFDEILMKVVDPNSSKDFTETFRIPDEVVRFFDSSGMSRNPNHMPTGDITAIINNEYQISSNALTDMIHLQTHDIAYLNFEAGDIVHISNGKYYIAGQNFIEGIARNAFNRDVITEDNGKTIPIYAEMPEIRFVTMPEMIEGMVINANGQRYSIKNNLPVPIDLGTGSEEKGYEIKLRNYLPEKAGKYHIVLDFPDSRRNRYYDFIYIPQFSFKFNYQPYIFQEEGSISFDCKHLKIIPNQADIQLNRTGDAFIFPIDQNHLRLSFSVRTKEEEIPFSIKVPCLRYSLGNDDWNTNVSDFIMKEELPNEILFDFSDDELTISLTSEGKESETLAKESDGFFHYRTNTVKNYSTGNRIKVDVFLSSPEIIKQFDEKKLFMSILLRSIIREKRITADFDFGILTGYIDVVGSKDYSVDIFCNGHVFAEDVSLINGKFSLKKNIENGRYQFDVYEKEEDEFGFGFERKLLDSFTTELIDIHNLSGKTIKINRLLIKNNLGSKSYKVQKTLFIRNLEKTENQSRHCYYGHLDLLNVKTRVFFPDINDLSLAYITYWDEPNKQYFDFEYGTITSRLLLEQEDSWQKGLFDRYLLLNCDEKEKWETPYVGVDMKTIFEVSVE